MALYRHNATGFIGEFATNPGAGYTAISSMPTTSIADRANWWRGIDTYGQTSDWHPSVDDDAEDPNDNFLALVFTNESALVSADPDGNVTDGFLGATTQVRVMRGSRNVTESEGWSLGLGKSPDVPSFTYTWTGTDYKTLQITGFPVDETSGYIRITAVRSGSQTLVKDFKFLKVIRGEDGTDGADGTRGSRQIAVSGTSWSDAVAWNAIISQFGGSTPVLSDLVTIADAATSFSVSKFYTGGAHDGNWEQPNEYINGNLLVTGTIAGNKLVANTITASKIATGTITTAQLSFTPVQSTNVVASINASAEGIRITGNRITLDGTVSFGVGYDPTGKIASGGAATDVNNNVTTISGGKITTGSITTAQLNFAPVTTSNVVASINATAEGIRIAGSRITLDGTVSFGAGYDPTTKIAAGGAATDINNNVTTISGGKITTGSITASQIKSGTITSTEIASGTITTSNLNFTPVTGSNVVATINASSEGLRIASGKIYIDGSVSFASGYDPSGKINNGGAATDINNNVTTISGGKITTGSLNADRIEAGTIKADRIEIGGVTTDRIGSNQVTKMVGATGPVVYFNPYTQGESTTAYIACDGGDLLVQVQVRLTANGTWMAGSSLMSTTYGVFWLVVNGSWVDSVTLYATKDPNAGAGISTATLSYYWTGVGTQTVSFYVWFQCDGNGSRQVVASAINGKR